jgi:hypothetical protein
MTKLRILSLIVGMVLLVVAIIAITCFPGSDKGQFIRMVKMLPEDIGSLNFVDIAVLQNDEDLQSTWNSIKEYYVGEDIYGENVSKITSIGIAGSASNVSMYAGDFDLEQMTSMIEQSSRESFEYEGINIWTDQNASSTAVIDDIVFVGSSEDIQLCVDVANGQGTSLYDNNDAKDIIGRLPGGYVLGISVMDSSENDYGLLAAGMAVSKQNGNISQASLLKFEDSDAAQGYITEFESQMQDYDVVQEGLYLTISSTSEIPSPEEEAYNSAYDDLQNAVVAYYYDNEGAFPTINGTVNISGYDSQILDICALLTSAGGNLIEVPEGIASVEGSDNDNCDTDCGGCSAANHYIWAVNDYGIYSTCVGANCSEYNSDGYQGVWP